MSAWDRRTDVKLTRHLKRSAIFPALKVGVEVMRGHRSVHLVGTDQWQTLAGLEAIALNRTTRRC